MDVPTDVLDSQDPVQADPGHRSTSDLDDLFDEPHLESFGDERRPGQLHGGLSVSGFNPPFLGATTIPNVDQGSNPSPHMVPLHHQWNTGLHFETSDPLLNNFGAPLFSTTEYTNPAGLTGLVLQNQFSSAAGNSQSDAFQFGAQLVGRRDQSPHQASDINTLPNQGSGDAGPDWITLIKPLPLAGENVIKLRRETHVALDIILERLPRQPPAGCSGIKIPATGSVKNYADATGKILLGFCIRLYGATTQRRYETVCLSCEKRESKKKGTPSLVDFYAEREIIELKDGKVRVEFSFCCYPKDHRFGDNEYLLEVVLSEDEDENYIVAQYQLPFVFNVVARLPPVQGHFPTSNPSLNNFRAPAPPLLESSSIPLFPGRPLPNETSSGIQLQVDDFPPVIPFQQPSEAVASSKGSLTNNEALAVERDARDIDSLLSTPNVNEPRNLDHDNGDVNLPDWIVLLKPLPQAGENLINVRRETHVALEIIPEFLPTPLPAGFGGIKIPATGSVTNYTDTTAKGLLEFRIHLYGATSKRRYETVCPSCEKREGKKKGTPSLIDFHAERDIIEPKGGKVRIDFTFCCYPKDHRLGDTEYLLDVVLSKDEDQNHIVAQYRLPFSFNVLARLPPGQRLLATQGKRRRGEREGAPPVLDPRFVRRRMDNASVVAQRGSPGSALPMVPLPLPSQNASVNSDQFSPWNPTTQAIAPPRTDGEPIPTLTEVNPESGSITGGARVWLRGIDFPSLFPLFARFGTTVVPTTFSASNLLACNLPSAATPGVVDVTLSKHPQPNAPEYGTSIARFHYLGDSDVLVPILLRIHAQGYLSELSPMLQALLTTLSGSQPNRGLQGGSHDAGPRDNPIETCLVEAPNFREVVSTTADNSHPHASIHLQRPSPSPSSCQVAHRPPDLRRSRSHRTSSRRHEVRSGQCVPFAEMVHSKPLRMNWV